MRSPRARPKIALDEKTGKPVPAVVKVAETSQAQRIGATPAAPSAPPQTPGRAGPRCVAAAASESSPLSPSAIVGGASDASQSFVKKWLSFGGDSNDANAVKAYEPAEPVPADVPLPPRRNAAAEFGEQAASVADGRRTSPPRIPRRPPSPSPARSALAGAPLQQ